MPACFFAGLGPTPKSASMSASSASGSKSASGDDARAARFGAFDALGALACRGGAAAVRSAARRAKGRRSSSQSSFHSAASAYEDANVCQLAPKRVKRAFRKPLTARRKEAQAAQS